jgi:hypothetical protein
MDHQELTNVHQLTPVMEFNDQNLDDGRRFTFALDQPQN